MESSPIKSDRPCGKVQDSKIHQPEEDSRHNKLANTGCNLSMYCRKCPSMKTSSSSTSPQRCHHSHSSSMPTRLLPGRILVALPLFLVLQLLVFAPHSCYADDEDTDLEQQREIACFDLLYNADTDSDLLLDESEYLSFLQARFAGCPAYANATSLTDAQELAFTTSACSCIVVTFNLTCCDPPLWSLPASETDEFALTAGCLAATTAAVADSCDIWDILDDVVDDVLGNGTDLFGNGTGLFGNGTDDGRGEDNDWWTTGSDASNASSFFTDESCVEDLDAADLNRDGFLDETEYLQFVQIRIYDDTTKYPDCDGPGESQSATFKTLACATCVFEGTCESCGTVLNITGVDEPDGLDFLQRTALEGICAAAETTAAIECAFPDSDVNATLPSDKEQDDFCAKNLTSFDVDKNSYLNEAEYAAFAATYYTDPECVFNSTSLAQAAAFDALSSASCLLDPECGDETEPRISIAGADGGPTFLEDIGLSAICTAAQTASDLDCSTDSFNSDSPSPTPSGTESSPTTDRPVAVPTPVSLPSTTAPVPTTTNTPPAPTPRTTADLEDNESGTSSSWRRSTNQLCRTGMVIVLVLQAMV